MSQEERMGHAPTTEGSAAPQPEVPRQESSSELEPFSAVGAYQAIIIPRGEEPETAPEAPSGEAGKKAEASAKEEEKEGAGPTSAPGEQQPEAKDPVAQVLGDPELLERVLRAEPAQKRIQRLANNLAGNLLQQKQQEEAQWREADAYYRRLKEDPDFYEEQVRIHGEDRVIEWQATYLRESKKRQMANPELAAQLQAVVAQLNQQMAQYASQKLRELPLYQHLPAEAKKAIDEPDVEGDWLTAMVEALKKIDLDRMLREARQAGATEAAAKRAAERGAPLPTAAEETVDIEDPRAVLLRWATATSEEAERLRPLYEQAKRKLGLEV